MNPNAEHILDWFHITMRLTVMHQMAKGLGAKGSELRERVIKELERIKWFLWHGNTFRALQIVSWLYMDIDADEPTEKQKNCLKISQSSKPTSLTTLGLSQIMGSDGAMVRPSPPHLWNRPSIKW